MNRKALSHLPLVCLLFTAVPAVAGGDAAAGQQKSQLCQACHGPQGRGSDPIYPVLAGQHVSYLEKALTDYREGKRENALMAGMATNLSDQDIRDLSAWYAGLDGLEDISSR